MKKRIVMRIKEVFLIIGGLTLFFISCSKIKEKTNPSCAGFTIKVSTWVNNHSAWVEQTGGKNPITYEWSNGETGSTIGGHDGTLEAGTYSVVVTDANGCVENGEITIIDELAEIENTIECVNFSAGYINIIIIDDGETEISEIGVYYSLTPDPDSNDIKVIGENTYYNSTIELSSLNPATTYYVRSYAINAGGISYADEISFTTNSNPSPFTIGQEYQGGIIGGISCDGQHGFIVATDYNNKLTQGLAEEMAESLVINGYSDWHLPTFDQLKEMRTNLFLQGLGTFHTGNTIYDAYWTSVRLYDTDYSCNYKSIYLNFNNNQSGYVSVCYNLWLKPVRDF